MVDVTVAPNATVDTGRREPAPVYCISHVYAHHASSSGYHRLGDYVGEVLQVGRNLKRLGDSVLRIPAKVCAWTCGVYEYSRHSCVAELGAARHMLFHRDSIYHFLYAEKGYRYSGILNRRRGNHLVGSFHYPPSKFFQMVPSHRHLRRLEHAIAVSTVQIELLESLVGKGRVTFVPHGVDTEYWVPARGTRPEGPFRCVFAGNHMRDFETLGTVIDLLHETGEDVEFVLLSYDRRCESLSQRPGVRWLSRTPDEVYRSELQGADLMVLPLTDSTAVNSVLEAMACGVPVVTSRGGVSDYVDEECAVLHDVGDAEGMAQSVIDLLRDQATLRAMGQAARQQACNLSWQEVAGKVRAVYESLDGVHSQSRGRVGS